MMGFSGKFVLRAGPELHQKLSSMASSLGKSLNQTVLDLLASPLQSRSTHFKPVIERFKPLAIIQFGSTNKGTARASSDVDFLVVLANTAPLSRDLYLAWDQLKLDPKWSPHFVHLPASARYSSIWLEVGLFGHFLFQQDDSAMKVVTQIREEIARGDWTRKLTHGQPYWIRKVDGTNV